MKDLATNGIPAEVTLKTLGLARSPYYRWLVKPVTDSEYNEAWVANAIFDAHRDDPEFGYRFLFDEVTAAGHKVSDRTVWRICSDNEWWCVFGKKKRGKKANAGAPGARRPCSQGLHRRGPEPVVADGLDRASDGRRKAVPLRDQGRLVQPDRRLLHR